MTVDGRTLGLALSGGGYRATLFGLGSLWRLNDAGLLGRIDRMSSVSGGSIVMGNCERQQHTELATARQAADVLGRELQAARRESDVQRARADALDQQLARLADLPANVEAVLRRARTSVKVARSNPAKRTGRRGEP